MKCGVYLVRVKGTDFYKIGNSEDVQRRFKGLQGANPFELELLHVWERRPYRESIFDQHGRAGRCRLEKYLHSLMEPHQVRPNSEWFTLSDSDVLSLQQAVAEYKTRPATHHPKSVWDTREIDFSKGKPSHMRIATWLRLLGDYRSMTTS